MDFSLSFYLLAAFVVLITGISKGGFAGGLGPLAVPLLTLMVDPRIAAAILLPILVCMDLFSVAAHHKNWDRAIVKSLLPAAMVGIVLGIFTFQWMSAGLIRLTVGILAIYFVLDRLFSLWRKRQGAPPDEQGLHSSGKARFWGCIAGFTSFVAHAGGPPIAIYLLPLRLDKSLLVGTSVVFFATVNIIKLVPYAWLGQFQTENLITSLILLPLAPIGVKLGVYLHHKVSEKWFYRLCYSLLGVAGLKLVFDGGSALI